MKILKFVTVAGLICVGIAFYLQDRTTIKYEANFSIVPKFSLVTSNELPFFESQIIIQPSYLPAAHSATFTKLANGDLLAFWFAGTKEGNPDVKIWHSIYHAGHWSLATASVDPQMISRANHRYVVKVGNPVIYQAKNGTLHLFVVSVSVGGWSGSNLNHLQSIDEGKTWSQPERIIVSPFFNLSTLIRTSAISLADGGFYLPVYHEFIRKYPEVLRFDASGHFIRQIRINGLNKMIQPSVMPISKNSAWVYFRNANKPGQARPLYAAKTNDAGKTWSPVIATNLMNPDSSLVAANLGNNEYLMVYNPEDRSQLMLAISQNGVQWRPIYKLESSFGKEYSYPALAVDNKFIDILYTDDRKKIKHVRFNRAWLYSKVGQYVK